MLREFITQITIQIFIMLMHTYYGYNGNEPHKVSGIIPSILFASSCLLVSSLSLSLFLIFPCCPLKYWARTLINSRRKNYGTKLYVEKGNIAGDYFKLISINLIVIVSIDYREISTESIYITRKCVLVGDDLLLRDFGLCELIFMICVLLLLLP